MSQWDFNFFSESCISADLSILGVKLEHQTSLSSILDVLNISRSIRTIMFLRIPSTRIHIYFSSSASNHAFPLTLFSSSFASTSPTFLFQSFALQGSHLGSESSKSGEVRPKRALIVDNNANPNVTSMLEKRYKETAFSLAHPSELATSPIRSSSLFTRIAMWQHMP